MVSACHHIGADMPKGIDIYNSGHCHLAHQGALDECPGVTVIHIQSILTKLNFGCHDNHYLHSFLYQNPLPKP